MTIIQIIGPYRESPARPGVTAADNIGRARYWAERINRAGAYCFCPHLNSGGMSEGPDGAAPPEHFVDGACEMILRCSRFRGQFAAWVLDGWRESAGATKELKAVNGLYAFTFYESDGFERLETWINERT